MVYHRVYRIACSFTRLVSCARAEVTEQSGQIDVLDRMNL